MDLHLDPRSEQYRKRYRDFVEGEIIPLEVRPESFDEHENIALPVLEAARAKAKAAGLWCPQMPEALGGQGLSFVGMAACYEEMNRSIFGPAVFNAAAPDDGNMMLLNKVATPAQKERWLLPIVAGTVRSAFAMTEPAPGCGSDPSMMLTAATRVGDHWKIKGTKWFITGAGVAKHFVVMARTSDDARRGHTAFLFDRDQPGWRNVRRIPIMGPEGTRRPLRNGVRRSGNRRRTAAYGGGRGFEGNADSPRTRAPYALYALAGSGQAQH